MDIQEAVKEVHKDFLYKADKKGLFDRWFVMHPDDQGKYRGDCDDFALTVLWKLCDQKMSKWILNVIILHKYRIIWATTNVGGTHVVGTAKGLYFDNWGSQALPKDEFVRIRKHKLGWMVPSFIMIIYLTAGAFTKKS